MGHWLFKEEPSTYSFADLIRDGRAKWDGVANALALKHLRAVKPGDKVFFYATGAMKAVVGEMKVVSAGAEGVEVEPVASLARAVTLAEIKQDPALQEWELVRLPRLSVMPVTGPQWKRVQEMSKGDAGVALGKTPQMT